MMRLKLTMLRPWPSCKTMLASKSAMPAGCAHCSHGICWQPCVRVDPKVRRACACCQSNGKMKRIPDRFECRHAYAEAVSGWPGRRAQLYVPRVLSMMAESSSARTEFQGGWQAVPSSAFLAWAPSLLSLLDTDVGAALVPLLEVFTSACCHRYSHRFIRTYS